MKKVASVVFCVAALCVFSSAAVRGEDKEPAKVNVTGTWKTEVEVAGQTGSPVFTLKQKGDKITGKYNGSFGEADLKGKAKGNKIEFEFTVNGTKIVYTGTIDKNGIKGEAKYGDLTGTWTGKREKAKK
jgi:hypothetical protein